MFSTIPPASHIHLLLFGSAWVVVSFLACTFLLPSCHAHMPSLPFSFLLEVLCLACGTPGWTSGTTHMLSTAGRDSGFISLSYGLLLWTLMLWFSEHGCTCRAPQGPGGVWCPLICSTQFQWTHVSLNVASWLVLWATGLVQSHDGSCSWLPGLW